MSRAQSASQSPSPGPSEESTVPSEGSKNNNNELGASVSRLDPDFQMVLEAKLMIKDIETQVSSIREWRGQQKELTEQRIKHNQEVADLSLQEHLKYSDRETKREHEDNLKIISKMKEKQEAMNIGIEATSLSQDKIGCDLLSTIAKADYKLNEKRHDLAPSIVLNDQHQAFLSSCSTLDSIFHSGPPRITDETKSAAQSGPVAAVDKNAWKNQLQQIEDELKEVQELLKD